jgi:hypothetical protein
MVLEFYTPCSFVGCSCRTYCEIYAGNGYRSWSQERGDPDFTKVLKRRLMVKRMGAATACCTIHKGGQHVSLYEGWGYGICGSMNLIRFDVSLMLWHLLQS